MRQPVQTTTFYARLPVIDKKLAQLHFVVVNCSDAVTSVFYSLVSLVSTHSLIFFAVVDCCAAALSLFSSDILIWSAYSSYSVQRHMN